MAELKLKSFISQKARPLPVILLADVSGSMSVDGKIDTLNRAVKEMFDSFKREDDIRAEIYVAVITFGGKKSGNALVDDVKIHSPFTEVNSLEWQEMSAEGMTPMGGAFSLLTCIIEDRSIIPSRAYTPTVILVSDGQPTDNWQAGLSELTNSERAKKAFRFAMAIGDDANIGVLETFLDDPEKQVFLASDARDITKFFRFVTMTVTNRTKSQNPNLPDPIDDIDDIEF
jgi:uncharacterized protein YegL